MKNSIFVNVSYALLAAIVVFASAEQAAQPRRDVFYVGGKYSKVTVSELRDDVYKS
jgi:hypothetical protein